VSEDAVSRIAQRLQKALLAWRQRPLRQAYPSLFLDATSLKGDCGERVRGWRWRRQVSIPIASRAYC
jgi:transposase-like protein